MATIYNLLPIREADKSPAAVKRRNSKKRKWVGNILVESLPAQSRRRPVSSESHVPGIMKINNNILRAQKLVTSSFVVVVG